MKKIFLLLLFITTSLTITPIQAQSLDLRSTITSTTVVASRPLQFWYSRGFNGINQYGYKDQPNGLDMNGENMVSKTYNRDMTAIYTSDFSSTEDLNENNSGIGIANVDAISDGIISYDDVYSFYSNTNNTLHYIATPNIAPGGINYTASFYFYIPSSNTNLDGFIVTGTSQSFIYYDWTITKVSNGESFGDFNYGQGRVYNATGSWCKAVLTYYSQSNNVNFSFFTQKLGNSTYIGANSPTDDLIYIKNLVVTPTNYTSSGDTEISFANNKMQVEADKAPIYESDFSAGVDGWVNYAFMTLTGNVDAYGETDVLQFVNGLTSPGSRINKDIVLADGIKYKLSFSYYIPSSNVCKFLKVMLGNANQLVTTVSVNSEWTNTSVEVMTTTYDNLQFQVAASSDPGDIFYIKNVTLTALPQATDYVSLPQQNLVNHYFGDGSGATIRDIITKAEWSDGNYWDYKNTTTSLYSDSIKITNGSGGQTLLAKYTFFETGKAYQYYFKVADLSTNGGVIKWGSYNSSNFITIDHDGVYAGVYYDNNYSYTNTRMQFTGVSGTINYTITDFWVKEITYPVGVEDGKNYTVQFDASSAGVVGENLVEADPHFPYPDTSKYTTYNGVDEYYKVDNPQGLDLNSANYLSGSDADMTAIYTITGAVDNVSDGSIFYDDCLALTGASYYWQPTVYGSDKGDTLVVKFKYYIPVSNDSINGLRIGNSIQPEQYFTTTGRWVDTSVIFYDNYDNGAIYPRFYAVDDMVAGTDKFDGDTVYIHGLEIYLKPFISNGDTKISFASNKMQVVATGTTSSDYISLPQTAFSTTFVHGHNYTVQAGVKSDGVLGSDLLSGWDFTTWSVLTGNVSVISSDSLFTGTGGNLRPSSSMGLTNTWHQYRIKGTMTSTDGSFQLMTNSLVNICDIDELSFDITGTFLNPISSDRLQLRFASTTNDTVWIEEFTFKPITHSDLAIKVGNSADTISTTGTEATYAYTFTYDSTGYGATGNPIKIFPQANDTYTFDNVDVSEAYDLSIEGWVKANSLSGYYGITGRYNGIVEGFDLGVFNGVPTMGLRTSTGFAAAFGGTLISTDWTYIEAFINRVGNKTVYANGSLINTESIANLGRVRTDLSLVVGTRASISPANLWDGQIGKITFTRTNGLGEVTGTSIFDWKGDASTYPDDKGTLGNDLIGYNSDFSNVHAADYDLAQASWEYLTKGDFTDSTWSWLPYSNNIVDTATYLGRKCIAVSYVSSVDGAYTYLRNSYDLSSDLTVDKWYKASFYVASNNPITMELYNGSTYASDIAINPSSWQRKEFIFQAKSAVNSWLGITSMNTGEIAYIDSLVVEPITYSDLAIKVGNGHGVNQVKNGDMELNSNWVNTGTPLTNEISSEVVHSGSYSRKIITDGANEGLRQDFTSVAGVTTYYELWIYTSVNAINVQLDYLSLGYYPVVPNQWNKISGTYKSYDASNYIQVSTTGAYTFYVDDIKVWQIGTTFTTTGTPTTKAYTFKADTTGMTKLNEDFSDNSFGWLTSGGSEISGGKARIYSSEGAFSGIYVNTLLEVGKTYKFTYKIDSASGTGTAINIPPTVLQNTVGIHETIFTATAVGFQVKRGSTVTDVYFDWWKIEELPDVQIFPKANDTYYLDNMDISEAYDLSIEGWFKYNSDAYGASLFSARNASGGLEVYSNGSRKLFVFSGWTINANTAVLTGNMFTLSEWSNYSLHLTRNETPYIIMDGITTTLTTISDDRIARQLPSPMRFGYGGGSYYLNGNIGKLTITRKNGKGQVTGYSLFDWAGDASIRNKDKGPLGNHLIMVNNPLTYKNSKYYLGTPTLIP